MKKIFTLLALTFCLNSWAQCPVIITGNTLVCDGSTTILTANGASSYIWMPGNLNGSSVIVTPLSATIYTVTGTTGTCTATQTIAIMVNPTPTLSAFAPSNIICSGYSANIYPNGATTYTLYPGNQTGTSFTVTPNVNTTYTINGTSGSTGCLNNPNDAAVVTITVNPSPSVTFTLTQDAAPHTWDIYASYTGGTPPYTYSWNWGDGSANSTTAYPSHTYSVAGTYSICGTMTDASGCVATYCQNDAVSRLGNNNTYSNMVYVNVFNGMSGIKQVSGSNEELTLFPNPSDGSMIHLAVNDLQVTEIKVYDVTGKLVLSQPTPNPSKEGNITVYLNSLQNGIYKT